MSGNRGSPPVRLVVVVAAGACALVAAMSASAAFPGQNGKIAFQTNRDGNPEIYTMSADGTNRVNLTRDPALDIEPHWSPDGTQIVFASMRDGNHEIFRMEADGSDVTQLTFTDGVANRWPSWTNDGRILFHRGAIPNRDVYRMNADGTGLTNLTEGPYDNAWASGAPRGPMIAFSRFSPEEGQHLFTLNTLSGVVKAVTPPSLEHFEVQANWSPNGNDLVIVRFDDDGTELYTVHKDGTELVQLTDTPERNESSPSFSPDGSKIVFGACTSPGTADQRCGNYVMNADGSGGETQVTRFPRAPYLETFTGDWIDPFWHTVLLGTGSSLAQTNGRLELAIAADSVQGPPYDNIDAHVGTNCKLVGDFDVRADFTLLEWPSANGVQVTVHAFETGGQVLRESQAWGEQYATWIPPVFTDVSTTALSGSLRLARAGGTLSGYYWNGADWIEIASGPTTSDDATIGLSASSFLNRFAHRAVRVAWDDFLIASGEIECPSWWTDATPDWQPLGK